MNKKSITFFMLVTPRDAMLADYSIRSFKKLIDVLQSYDWTLCVYLNCLTDELKKKYVHRWSKIPYVQLIDNAPIVKDLTIIPGEKVRFKGISTRPYEGEYEVGCVVWEREFRKMDSDYWCLVDADFEILETDFISLIFQELEQNKQLYVFSTDNGDTRGTYNSYCDEHIISVKRFDTWFCVYKRECLKCTTPLYYHEEVIDEKKWVWDDTGKFQEDLKKLTGCQFQSVSQIASKTQQNELMYQYIHYGAFSKNASLDKKYKVFLYRKITILSHRGILYFKRKSLINKCIRLFFSKMRILIYTSILLERKVYQNIK